MTAVSLAFLVVCVFGAFAYGSATLMALRQATPVWAAWREGQPPPLIDRVNLAMFGICTVWFALNAFGELQLLVGARTSRTGPVELATFAMAFVFPPLIIHLVYRETSGDCSTERGPLWRWLVAAMYVVSPTAGVLLVGMAIGWFERPERLVVLLGAGLFGAESPVMPWALVVLAALSFFTAFQRVLHVRKRLRAPA